MRMRLPKNTSSLNLWKIHAIKRIHSYFDDEFLYQNFLWVWGKQWYLWTSWNLVFDCKWVLNSSQGWAHIFPRTRIAPPSQSVKLKHISHSTVKLCCVVLRERLESRWKDHCLLAKSMAHHQRGKGSLVYSRTRGDSWDQQSYKSQKHSQTFIHKALLSLHHIESFLSGREIIVFAEQRSRNEDDHWKQVRVVAYCD